MNLELIIARAIFTGIALIVVLPILYAVIGYLWNKKLRPRRIQKGLATAQFQNIVKRFIKFSFKEDPAGFLEKTSNEKLRSLTKLKTFYILSLLLAVLGYIIVGSGYLVIPLVIMFCVAFGRANKVFNERNKLLTRMFAVANSTFRYGKAAEYDPWHHVNVTEWTDLTTPGKTVILFPPSFRTDQIGSRDSFEQHFTSTITDANIWTYEWDAPKGEVTASPVKHLPTMAPYPGVGNTPWNIFLVGEGADGPIYYDIMKTPHMLLGGSTGSGKSVLQRNIVFHCIQHNDRMRFLGVDLKRVELSVFNKYKRTVIGIGTDKEQGLGVVKYAYDQMQERYKMMEEKGVNNFIDLADPPYALLLMIDEAFMFLGLSGSKTDEGKAEDQMAGEASDLIGKLLRLGRASGVFIVMATQRPDATVIKGEMKNNMDVRIAAGRMDSTPSSMILDSGAATQLPGHIKGRGVIRFTGEAQQFQGYFAEQTWIDDWLLDHPEVEPTTVEEGGHLHEAYVQRQLDRQAAAAGMPAEQSTPDAQQAPQQDAGSAKPAKAPKEGKIPFSERFSVKPKTADDMNGQPAATSAPQQPASPVAAPVPVSQPVVPPAPVPTSVTPVQNVAPVEDKPLPTIPSFFTKPVEEEPYTVDASLDFDFEEDAEPEIVPEPVAEKDMNDPANWVPMSQIQAPAPVAPPIKKTAPVMNSDDDMMDTSLETEPPAVKQIPVPPKAAAPSSPFAPKHQSPFKPKSPANPFDL